MRRFAGQVLRLSRWKLAVNSLDALRLAVAPADEYALDGLAQIDYSEIESSVEGVAQLVHSLIGRSCPDEWQGGPK